MICSDTCFVCGDPLNQNNSFIYECEIGCTCFFDAKTFYLFKLLYLDIEISYSHDLLRFDYYILPSDNVTRENSIFSIDCPIKCNYTYDVSEYLISFIPQINKMKAFL